MLYLYINSASLPVPNEVHHHGKCKDWPSLYPMFHHSYLHTHAQWLDTHACMHVHTHACTHRHTHPINDIQTQNTLQLPWPMMIPGAELREYTPSLLYSLLDIWKWREQAGCMRKMMSILHASGYEYTSYIGYTMHTYLSYKEILQ